MSDSFRSRSDTMQTEQDLDISVIFSTFFLRNIGLWISDNLAENRWMKIKLMCTLFNSIDSSIVIMRDFYFTWLYKGVSIVDGSHQMKLRRCYTVVQIVVAF